MGCTISKLDNEDAVRRCRERRRLTKEALLSRHHLAAAQSDYCRSLHLTGSALIAFAAGIPISVSEDTPAVLLRTPSTNTKPPTFIPPHSPSVHPRPPSPPESIATSSSHHKKPPPPPPLGRKPIKVPHILSDSSFSSSPRPNHDFSYRARPNSTYSSTLSETSSVWNWENFYPPPSPPNSDYFQQLENNRENKTLNENNSDDNHGHPYSEHEMDDRASNRTTPFTGNRSQVLEHLNPSKVFGDRASNYSSFSHSSNISNNTFSKTYTKQKSEKFSQNPRSWESEEEGTEREEVQCSEWGDHENENYSRRSISSDDGDETGDSKSGAKPQNLESAGNAAATNSKFSSKSEKPSSEDDDSKPSVYWEKEDSGRKIEVRHKNLAEIAEALSEFFDEAASAGEKVSEMLETDRAHLDRGFKQLRKTIYHSGGMLSNFSSSWTSKPPLAVKYRLDPGSVDQFARPMSLCSTLERLVVWESKLYQEVKAREGVKIEHEKKLSVLQRQECRGEDEAKLDKTKASIKRLQSLILVTSQAVSSTSFAVTSLRDSGLVPQLVELCRGFMCMWRSMNRSHEIQQLIVQQVRGLTSQKSKDESTLEPHRQATLELESAIATWHSSFRRLIRSQSEFVLSLHAWLEITLLPLDNNEPQNHDHKESSRTFFFLDGWKLALEQIPDTAASEAIQSLNNVVRSISLKQTEEIKSRNRVEVVSKVLEKRALALADIERKYYGSCSTVGIEVGDKGGPAPNVWDPLAEKKAELAGLRRRVEDEMVRHSKAVEVTQAMTLNNVQTGLPSVFQAMTGFSASMAEALEAACRRSCDILS